VVTIVEQLLLPFLAGQFLRPWIGAWVDRNKPMLKIVDQGSILLVVYTAFSESVNEGLWHKLSLSSLVSLGVLCCVMLAIALGLATFASRASASRARRDHHRVLRLEEKPGERRADGQGPVRAGALGMVILPLMLFHQIQLMVCAVLAAALGAASGTELNRGQSTFIKKFGVRAAISSGEA
jgi:sodium/bile acid cotransporter 7